MNLLYEIPQPNKIYFQYWTKKKLNNVIVKAVIIAFEMESKSKNQGDKKIDKYIFSLKNAIGQGAYATVYLGRTIGTNENVAIKVIDKKVFANSYNFKNIQLEIDIMKQIEHENIVKLLDVYQSSNNMYIITEYCEEGDLANYLKKKKKLSDKESLKFLKEIMKAFEYLVEREITHRDLKPANILIKDGCCKISDFGFAKNLEDGESTVMKSIVGTPLYMSPQILSRMKYTNKSDLWSIGLIYYEMLHGYTPWPAKNEIQLINNIMSKTIQFESGITEKSKDFIRGCLRIKDEDRISWDDAFNHPVFKSLAPRKTVILIEEDKENINANIMTRDPSSKSLKVKRDTSEHRAKTPVIGDRKASKTPTRSKLNQILALTPKDREKSSQGNQSSFALKKKPTLSKTESSLNIRPRFK